MASETAQRNIDILLLDFATERKGECLFDELWASSSAKRAEGSVALIAVLRITVGIEDYIILKDLSFRFKVGSRNN